MPELLIGELIMIGIRVWIIDHHHNHDHDHDYRHDQIQEKSSAEAHFLELFHSLPRALLEVKSIFPPNKPVL